VPERKHADDPALSGGSTVGTGDPHARNEVVYDTRNAVIVEEFETSIAHATSRGKPAPDSVALVIRGRRNRPPDDEIAAEAPRESVEHLHLMSWDAAANLIVDIQSLAARDGFDLIPILEEKWLSLVDRGLTMKGPK
jgi:hypothetical protein